MRYAAAFLAGCLATVLAITWISASAASILLWICVVTSLFFTAKWWGYSFLIGTTVSLELLGTAHFGLAVLVATATYGLYQLFANQLRFTSLELRYLCALVLSELAFTFFLADPTDLGAWISLVLWTIVATVSIYSYRGLHDTSHDLSRSF